MNKKLIILIFVVITIILGIFVFLQVSDWNNNSSDKITAMEGYAKAKEIAKNQSNNSILCGVTPMNTPDVNGRSTGWRFYYLYNLGGNLYEGFDVKVYATQNSTMYFYGTANTTPAPILNWSYDSNVTINIAKENQNIKNFLSRYHDAEIDQFELDDGDIYSENAIWEIRWQSWGTFDDPHNAHIIIDASTGEVLYVEADS